MYIAVHGKQKTHQTKALKRLYFNENIKVNKFIFAIFLLFEILKLLKN